MPESGTRPYIDKTNLEEGIFEDDHTKRMRRPTWANQMNVMEEKHSEMVKPYDWDDYHQQEHFYPNPIFNPEWPGDQPTEELVVDRAGTTLLPCGLFAVGNGGARNQCSRPIRVDFTRVSASVSRADPKRVKVYNSNISGDPLTLIKAIVEFDGLDRFLIRPPVTTTWTDFIEAGDQFTHILVLYEDPLGSVCSDLVEVFCVPECDCPSGDFAFDDASTPDTIAPGGSISIFISGGCGPYSWSVAGLGYTLDNATTPDLSNGLNSAAGTCSVNYGPVATVTVTDNCSDSVVFEIRNTGGTWTLSETITVANTCTDTGGVSCSGVGTATLIVGKKRWLFTIPATKAGDCAACHSAAKWPTWGGGAVNPPSIGPYVAWTTYESTLHPSGACCVDGSAPSYREPTGIRYKYYTWTC